jgi:hypothetical protein
VPTDAPSLRDTLESAISAQAEAEPVEVEPAPVDAPEPPAPESTPAPAAARARDTEGRFSPKPKDSGKPAAAPEGAEKAVSGKAAVAGQGKADGVTPPPVAPSAPPVPGKVPQSWKPAMRELAAKLPAEFHPLIEESLRRDGEVSRALQETAEARKTIEQVQRTLQPFEGIARANGMDLMSYAGSVMQTAAQLFQGPPGNRAALIAQLIKQAGVNPEDVNPYLSGEAQPQARQQPAFDPRAEVQRAMAEERQRMEAEQGQATVQEFLAAGHEFVNDVWPDMVAIINADRAAHRKPDLSKAYDRACRMNEDVSRVLDGRKAADAARAQAPTVRAAKAAAVSIKPSAAAATPGRPSGSPSLRETIEAAVAGQRT